MSRYDKRHPDSQVLKLTRAGHYLWFQLKSAKLASTHKQETALSQALEIIWDTKRKLKAELATERSRAFKLRDPFPSTSGTERA